MELKKRTDAYRYTYRIDLKQTPGTQYITLSDGYFFVDNNTSNKINVSINDTYQAFSVPATSKMTLYMKRNMRIELNELKQDNIIAYYVPFE